MVFEELRKDSMVALLKHSVVSAIPSRQSSVQLTRFKDLIIVWHRLMRLACVQLLIAHIHADLINFFPPSVALVFSFADLETGREALHFGCALDVPRALLKAMSHTNRFAIQG